MTKEQAGFEEKNNLERMDLSSTGFGSGVSSSTASGEGESSDSIWSVYFLGLNVWIWGGIGLIVLIVAFFIIRTMKQKEISFMDAVRDVLCCCCSRSDSYAGPGLGAHCQYTRGIVAF